MECFCGTPLTTQLKGRPIAINPEHQCGHVFCYFCIIKTLTKVTATAEVDGVTVTLDERSRCPLCRTIFDRVDTVSESNVEVAVPSEAASFSGTVETDMEGERDETAADLNAFGSQDGVVPATGSENNDILRNNQNSKHCFLILKNLNMSFAFIVDWNEISPGKFYRKTELYTMGWSHVDLENFSLVGASYGGPLATIKDDKKFVRVTVNVPAKPIIHIYTAVGTLISSIKWDSGTLIKMGWSASEDLLCIQEDGNVLVYNLLGNSKETVHCSISSESKEKAYEAEIFPSNNGTGVAYLTTNENFIVVNNYKTPTVRRYAKVPGDGPITAWAVVSSKRHSSNSSSTNIIAARGSLLFTVDPSQYNQEFLEFTSPAGINASIVYIAVSMNGESIAIFTESGVLWLGSSDFSKKYCEYCSGIRSRPKQIVWCGNEAVVMSWENNLSLVNKQAKFLNFIQESQFYIIPEIDCVRVVSNNSHEVIQKVSKVSQDIFGIGSVEPGAVLVEASKEFQNESHKADELIKCIANINRAVEQCIKAAGYEFQSQHQKMLMKAAQFGKCFLTKYSPEEYIHTCQMLRIMNAVKDYRIGIPITYTQLENLGFGVLIDRLVLRRQYSLAIKIAEFLKLRENQGKSRILNHWACYKVGQKHVGEMQLANEIHNKLKSDPSISYSEIANKAFDAGRKKLALHLAQYEVRRSVQVDLLLKLGDNDTSLLKAVESGDSDLVYKVLLHLKENMPLPEFQVLIRKYPTAQSLYIKYCNIYNPDSVRDVYEQEDNFSSQGDSFIRDSYSEKKIESRLSALISAQEMFKKAKNDFMSNICEEQHRLLKYQISLQQKYMESCVDETLRDTIKMLLKRREIKLADKLRTEFKVPDRMYWWIRLETLGELRDWIELEKMSKTKKFPGGFEDFVEVCLQADNSAEAQKYLPKIKEEFQVKYYMLAGLYEEAAQIAVGQKDEEALQDVYSKSLSEDRQKSQQVKAIMDAYRTAVATTDRRNK